jgi:imidazolonepropionase-like amidohydrolase
MIELLETPSFSVAEVGDLMRKINILFLFLLLPKLLFAQPAPVLPARSLVFTHVTVIDVTAALPKSDMTVIVSGNRIVAVARTGKVRLPKNAQIINAEGKFLIPGLWDMHAHTRVDPLTRQIVFRLNIANGVTGIRDMAGDCVGGEDCDGKATFDVHLQWKKDMANGTLIGPRMIVATAFVDGKPPLHSGSMVVSTPEEAREAVRYAKRRGIDFIKVYVKLSRESYFALADEAKKLGIPFAGHVPVLVGAIEASEAGQKSEEHLYGALEACSGREAEFVAAREQLAKTQDVTTDSFGALFQEQISPLSYTSGDCSVFFRTLVKNGTWVVPTFNYWRSIADYYYYGPQRVQDSIRLRYIPVRLKDEWFRQYKSDIEQITEEAAQRSRQKSLKRLSFVKRLHDGGVGILAGTDSDMPFTFPGFDLHDELAMFVEGGLTPLEALQTATLNPAKYLNKLDSFGTVEKGKLADLVLLEANPLDDINNTRRISAVVVDGRYFSNATLKTMLAEVETTASKK